MIHCYRLFGLLVRTNVPAPDLTPVDKTTEEGILFEVLGAQPTLPLPAEADGWRPVVRGDRHPHGPHVWRRPEADGIGLRLQLSHPANGGVLEIAIAANQDHVQARWDRTVTITDLWSIWTAMVLPYLLRRRGWLCLHASTVAQDDGVAALVGVKGAGKSTTALALAQRGAGLIADDIAALTPVEGGFLVWPGPPRLNLWPDAAELLMGDAAQMPRTVSVYEKRLAILPHAETTPRMLTALILLDHRDPTLSSPALLPVPAREALMLLTGQLSAAHLPVDQKQARREFEMVGRLVSTLPVLRLQRSTRLEDLPQICGLIENALAARSPLPARPSQP